MPAEVEIYRNLTRRRWSVRVGKWVAAHMEGLALRDVVFKSSEASRARMLRTGNREVHAWARGVPVPGLALPADAVRVRYRPRIETGFRDPEGGIIIRADLAWFEADGSCWACLDTCTVRPHPPFMGRVSVTTGAHP